MRAGSRGTLSRTLQARLQKVVDSGVQQATGQRSNAYKTMTGRNKSDVCRERGLPVATPISKAFNRNALLASDFLSLCTNGAVQRMATASGGFISRKAQNGLAKAALNTTMKALTHDLSENAPRSQRQAIISELFTTTDLPGGGSEHQHPPHHWWPCGNHHLKTVKQTVRRQLLSIQTTPCVCERPHPWGLRMHDAHAVQPRCVWA
eukprot:364259-Chlamydomonas_euryale.AAC.9